MSNLSCPSFLQLDYFKSILNYFKQASKSTLSPHKEVKSYEQQTPISQDHNQVVCQICGKVNHVAIDSWNRYDHSYQSNDIPKALAAMNLMDEPDSTIYADSEALAHITNNTGNLSNLQNYLGKDIKYILEMVKVFKLHT